MIDLFRAINIAKEYYSEKGQQEITKAYDAETVWIVYAGKKEQLKYGNHGIAIDKKSGEISRFILPSRSNFEILKNAKLVELE